MAHLFYEFILELRYRWDNCDVISGVSSSEAPDLGMCLLQQKLQMLNCCINHRATREKLANQKDDSVGTEEDFDEFYDCVSDEEEEEEEEEVPTQGYSEWNKPEGRLKTCGNLRLLSPPNFRMYVPVTQDPAPVTEDRREEQEEVISLI